MAVMGRRRKSETDLQPRVYLRRGVYFYVHRETGKWENLGPDKILASRKAALYNDPDGEYGTLLYWLKMFIADCEGRVLTKTLSPRTLEDYINAVGKVSKDGEWNPGALALFFEPPITPLNVTPDMVQDFLSTNAQLGRPVPANREKAALSSCFGWLIRTGKVPGLKINPCLRASGIKRNPETKRDRYVSHEDYRDVFAEAPLSVRLLMELTYRTLQRPESDIIHWTNEVLTRDGNQRILEFTQAKTFARTGKRMRVALTDDLMLLLKQGLGNVVKLRQHLIHTRDGQPYTYDGISAMLKRAIARANKLRAQAAAPLIKSFGFRDLKGKGATDMWQAGVPIEQIQMLCGHEDKATTEIYVKQRWQQTAQPNLVKLSNIQ